MSDKGKPAVNDDGSPRAQTAPEAARRLLISEVVQSSCNAIFGRPLVTNVYRSVVVEAIVAMALKEWEWVSTDYYRYDFRHPNGTRLEVKQTAVKQSWSSVTVARPSWDIKERTGYWEGNEWIAQVGRNADVYVLALHETVDEAADHRDPEQWRFFVLPTTALPATQRLSLPRARSMSVPVTVDELADAVDRCMRDFAATTA